MPDYVPPDHATGLTPNATPYWMTGGCGAEVEVDTETGHVRVLRLVNVADAGTPINPRIVETQLTGAAVMQLGFTLSEDMVFTNGQLRNPSFADYKIPGIRDMPEFSTGERYCEIVSRSAGRAKAAARGCAAAAPCWSTARRCRAVSTSPCSPTAPSVKPVALDTVRLQFLGDRQDTRNLRLAGVKGGVEARCLRKPAEMLLGEGMTVSADGVCSGAKAVAASSSRSTASSIRLSARILRVEFTSFIADRTQPRRRAAIPPVKVRTRYNPNLREEEPLFSARIVSPASVSVMRQPQAQILRSQGPAPAAHLRQVVTMPG